MTVARSFAMLLLAACLAAPGFAADRSPTRAQALRSLAHESADVRRAAIERLGAIGTMNDAHRIAARLRDADARVRSAAEAAMWSIWSRSGDAAIDSLYRRGVEQVELGKLDAALATFSQIVERKPAFAEGWNKRATVLYLLGRHEESLRDCDEVMRRNPNHFGALSGYGQNHLRLGRYEDALEAFERALQVNPNLDGAATAVQILEQQIAERRKRAI